MIEEKIQQKLDYDMQLGYEFMKNNKPVAACIEWGKVWELIVSTMDACGYESMESFDKDFHGLQCVYNWVSDYECELGNATMDDVSFAQKRIDFCTEYSKRYSDKSEFNLFGMKKAIAESYFSMGKKDIGEGLFEEYLKETPTWGWGWIGWSDEYGMFPKLGNKDIEKAIGILKQALEIKGLEDSGHVKARLNDLYEANRMQE